MHLIVAVDSNWGIGRAGKLLFSIPEDIKLFRRVTSGKAVIMGHSTLLSLPGAKPLPGRANIILSHDAGLKIENAAVCHSIEDILRTVSSYEDDQVFMIGGEAVYRQLLDNCSVAYVTKIRAAVQDADRFFPNLDQLENWMLYEESEEKEYDSLSYSFCIYHNRAVKMNPYRVL